MHGLRAAGIAAEQLWISWGQLLLPNNAELSSVKLLPDEWPFSFS